MTQESNDELNESDVAKIQELITRAVRDQDYMLASLLRDSKKYLMKKLIDKWNNEILSVIDTDF